MVDVPIELASLYIHADIIYNFGMNVNWKEILFTFALKPVKSWQYQLFMSRGVFGVKTFF